MKERIMIANEYAASQNSGRRLVQAGEESCHRAAEMVRTYPASSAFATFACGCGLGVMTALLLQSRRHEPPLRSRNLPHQFSTEWLGSAVERVLPKALSQYLGK
jgi:hypothetical protein